MRQLISVIVPVYNSEQFLNDCIQSIVNQTYNHIEIILIDDGSTDRSSTICDFWSRTDHRVKVIHKTNEGSAKARNIALRIANGDYIAFADSDDILHPKMFEILHSIAETSCLDIVECDYTTRQSVALSWNMSNTIDVKDIEFYNAEEALQQNIKDKYFRQIIWNKIYRRNVVRHIFFEEGRIIDDEFWTYRVIGNSKSLGRITQKLYYYRQNSQSVMHQEYSIHRLDALKAKTNRLDYIIEFYPRLTTLAKYNLFFSCIYASQVSIKSLKKTDKRKAVSIIKEYMSVCKFTKSELKNFNLKSRFWVVFAESSFVLCCKVRNIFRIGL